MKNYLFPKFFNNMSIEQLCELCLRLGIDDPTLMVRGGYWVDEKNIFEKLPQVTAAIRRSGAQVSYADTSYRMDTADKLDDVLSLMSHNGIELFRVSYIAKKSHSARELHDALRFSMEKAEKAARKHGIKAVVQIHGGMYPHNASTAYFACKDLDPQYLGIKIDLGNNLCQEGFENIEYQVDLLGEYVAAVGEKDAALIRKNENEEGSKGWERAFVPAYKGIANYDLLFASLKKNNISVPGVLMPFYHGDEMVLLEKELEREVAYFKRCQEENGL